MLAINKNEAMYLRNNLKEVCIYRTMKYKGRGRWFVEETSQVLNLLKKFNENTNITEEYPAH